MNNQYEFDEAYLGCVVRHMDEQRPLRRHPQEGRLASQEVHGRSQGPLEGPQVRPRDCRWNDQGKLSNIMSINNIIYFINLLF